MSPASRSSNLIRLGTATSRRLNGHLMANGWLIRRRTQAAQPTFICSLQTAKTSRHTRSRLILTMSAVRALLPTDASYSSSVRKQRAEVEEEVSATLRSRFIQQVYNASNATPPIPKTDRQPKPP